MKCPSCSTAAGDDAPECSACGLVFAKWREREEKIKKDAAAALAALESPPAAKAPDPWLGRAIAIAVVAVWMLGMAVYYHMWLSRVRVAP